MIKLLYIPYNLALHKNIKQLINLTEKIRRNGGCRKHWFWYFY